MAVAINLVACGGPHYDQPEQGAVVNKRVVDENTYVLGLAACKETFSSETLQVAGRGYLQAHQADPAKYPVTSFGVSTTDVNCGAEAQVTPEEFAAVNIGDPWQMGEGGS